MAGPTRRLWRQRRRLAVATLCCYLGAAQPVAPWSGGDWGLALLPTLVFLVLGAAVVLLAPQWRGLVTRSGFAVLATISISWAWPMIYQFPSWLLVLAGFALLPLAMAPVWRLRLPGIRTAAADRVLSIQPEQLWQRVFPGGAAPYWDPAVEEVSGTAPVLSILAGGRRHRVEVFDIEPPGHFKMRPLDGASADGREVSVASVVIDAHPYGSTLTLMEGTWHPRLGDALALWLDDYLRDHLDRMEAVLEQRPDWSLRTALARSSGPAAPRAGG